MNTPLDTPIPTRAAPRADHRAPDAQHHSTPGDTALTTSLPSQAALARSRQAMDEGLTPYLDYVQRYREASQAWLSHYVDSLEHYSKLYYTFVHRTLLAFREPLMQMENALADDIGPPDPAKRAISAAKR